jgi:hypothetical protein
MKIEGYWAKTAKEKSEYPFPIANILSEEERKFWLLLLQKKQKYARKTQYRGISKSRLTKEMVGSAEYQSGNWIWPEGLSHYVEHGVDLTAEFKSFLLGNKKNV